jgi:hypothetical protein
MIRLAGFGQPSRALGADAPAPTPTTSAPSATATKN